MPSSTGTHGIHRCQSPIFVRFISCPLACMYPTKSMFSTYCFLCSCPNKKMLVMQQTNTLPPGLEDGQGLHGLNCDTGHEFEFFLRQNKYTAASARCFLILQLQHTKCQMLMIYISKDQIQNNSFYWRYRLVLFLQNENQPLNCQSVMMP